MSAASWVLFGSAAAALVGFVVRDWAKRTGRSAPWSGARTTLRRRGVDGEPSHEGRAVQGGGVLGAGFAAQILAPLLARAESSIARAAGSLVVLSRLTERLDENREELTQYKSSLGDRLWQTLMAMPRWQRKLIYTVALSIDVGAGLFVAHQMNVGGLDAVSVGASYGLMLLFAGHLAGLGMRRLDLHPAGSDPDVGKRSVSWALMVIGFGWLAACCGGLMAARRIAAGFSQATAAGSVQSPAVPSTLVLVLSSLITVGTFATALALAMKWHPDTHRLEELSWGVARRDLGVRWGVRRLARAISASGRALGLLNASVAELQCRVGSVVHGDQWRVIVERARVLQIRHDQNLLRFRELSTLLTTPEPELPQGPPVTSGGSEADHEGAGDAPAAEPVTGEDPLQPEFSPEELALLGGAPRNGGTP